MQMETTVKISKRTLYLIVGGLVVSLILFGFMCVKAAGAGRVAPVVVVQKTDTISLQQATIDAAKVFGRGNCGTKATYQLIDMVAKQALKDNNPPGLLAAIVSIESGCDPLAISSKQAVGLMQIHVPSWKSRINFAEHNLFDAQVNLEIGSGFLRDLRKQYGNRGAMLHYNNMNEEYASQVMQLSGVK